MIKFTYRSISGENMPSEHNGDAKSLRKQFGEFGGSCTPISSIEGEPIDLSKFILGEMDAVHNQINELIEERIKLHLHEYIIKEDKLQKIVDQIYRRKLNPYHFADKIAKKVIKPRRRKS